MCIRDRAEQIAGRAGYAEAYQNERQVQPQQHHYTEKPEFLGQHAEDEVGGSLGQDAQRMLRSLEQALAEQAARPDGDLSLLEVVACLLYTSCRPSRRSSPRCR